MNEFFAELRRRNVTKVAVAYSTVSVAAIGTAAVVEQAFGWRHVAVATILLALIGFPIALILAWFFALIPESEIPADSRHASRLPAPGSELASVAVLPFRNLTPQAELGFLVEALPLELNYMLSRIHRLRVISNSTSMARGATNSSLGALASELGVQYAIAGAVSQSGDRVRVITELGDAETDSLLWSRTFEVDADNFDRVPQHIATAVVSEFGGERLRAEIGKLVAHSPRNATAWQCVQASRAYLIDYTEENLVKAVASLKKALKLDPSYAVAHATLGQVLAEKTLAGISRDPERDRRDARAAVTRAESLAPRDPIVLRAAGCVNAYTGEYRQALTLLRRALDLTPYDFGTWGYLGWPLVATGSAADLDELIAIVNRLLQGAPKHPGRPYWLYHHSVALLCSGEAERAVQPARQSLDEQPSFLVCAMHLANVLGVSGQSMEARAVAESCTRRNSLFTVDYYADLMHVLSDQATVVEKRTSGLVSTGLLVDTLQTRRAVSESV